MTRPAHPGSRPQPSMEADRQARPADLPPIAFLAGNGGGSTGSTGRSACHRVALRRGPDGEEGAADVVGLVHQLAVGEPDGAMAVGQGDVVATAVPLEVGPSRV